MAHPKRKHSKSRTAKRKAGIRKIEISVVRCSNCGAVILPHRVCEECGYYKGQPILTIKKKEEK